MIIQCNLLLESSNYSIFEHIDEYVELIVATPANIFFPVCLLTFEESKPTSITLSIFLPDSGTQRVFPLLAIICSKIFVAILLKFFLLRVPSVAIWHTILFLKRHFYLICLYCPFKELGMSIKQMLQFSFYAALYTH